MKMRLFLWRLIFRASKYAPVQCVACGRGLFRKDAKFERTTAGAIATLCPKCRKSIFEPYNSHA